MLYQINHEMGSRGETVLIVSPIVFVATPHRYTIPHVATVVKQGTNVLKIQGEA
jgi:hypothetical protein